MKKSFRGWSTPLPSLALTQTQSTVLASVGLVLLIAVLWAPILFGNVLFSGDRSRWLLPAIAMVRDALSHNELPVWNRYVGLGFATTNDPLYGFGYPLNWLLLFGSPSRAQSLVAGLHLLMAGGATMALARLLGAGVAGSFVSAVGFALSGVTLSMISAGLLLHAAALVPCTVLALSWAFHSQRHWALRVGVAAAVTGAALLQGEVFVWCMSLVVSVVVIVAVPRKYRSATVARESARKRAMVTVTAVFLAVLLGMLMVLPAAMGLSLSERGEAMSRSRAEISSLHPLRALEFIAPGAFLPLGTVDGPRPVVGEPRLGGRNLVDCVYLGAALVALALCAPGRKRRRENTLAVGAGLFFLVALGRHTPVHAVWRTVFFPFSRMRFPERYMIPVALLVALLAGLGLRRVRGDADALRWPPSVLAVVLVMLAWVVPWALGRGPTGDLASSMQQALVSGAVAAFVVAIAVWWMAKRNGAAMVVAVGAVVVDLFLSSLRVVDSVPETFLDQPGDGARLVLADARQRSVVAPPRVIWSERMFSGFAHGLRASELEFLLRRTLMFSTPAMWNIATINPYDVGLPPSWQRVWDRFKRAPWRLLRFTGARWMVYNDLVEGGDSLAPRGIKPWVSLDPGVLALQTFPTSRVFVSHAVRVVQGDHPETELDSAVMNDEVVLVASRSRRRVDPAVGPERCEVREHRATRVVFDCEVTTGAVAVLREQFHPGWSATVDGRPEAVVQANAVMRGVFLAAGRHRIEMVFRAPGLRAGAAVSVVTFAGLLGLVTVGVWRSRVRESGGK